MVDLVKIRKKAKEKRPSALGPQPSEDRLARFLETAGQRRTKQTTETAPAGDQVELLTFMIAGELYAIDIEKVVEIAMPSAVTRVPNAEPAVVGIVSLRGMIVTLIDVRRRLHHPPAVAGVDSRVIVVDHEGGMLGFVVDRVQRVVKVDSADVEPQPVAHTSEQDESVRGVFRIGDALTIFLDLDKLLERSPSAWN